MGKQDDALPEPGAALLVSAANCDATDRSVAYERRQPAACS
jgi:hypothetical protein